MVDGGCDVYQGSLSGNECSGRQSNHGSSKRGLNTKVHLAVDAHGRPLRATITSGTVADCTEFRNLLEKVDQQPEHVIADKGYDSDELIKEALIKIKY